ncbi:MAG: NCS2 family permease [Acidobacteria bacterium]|nr:NCS2 family permease [Acidobacteriota bacterium]
MTPGAAAPKWFVRGDLDGFFGLAVDNLIQFLLILDLCVSMCGLEASFVVSRILPGAAVSLLVGNLFYAWQARRLAAREGRDDVTALPFGINTISLFAFVLFVMAPTFQEWSSRPGVTREQAAMVAWQVGLVACFLSGVIEAAGGLIAARVRRATPRAALLATLAGIAVGFISMEFVLRTFQHPLVAFVPLAILLARYLGGVRLPFGLPGGLVAITVGTAIAWSLHFMGLPGTPALGGDIFGSLGVHLPILSLSPLLTALSSPDVWGRISIIVPMGLINVLGSLQSLESAEAEGDAFPSGSSLAVNGVATIAASAFGSCFPTTLYIGHPGWKRLGARSGYSVLNAAFFTVVAFTGLIGAIARVVPIEAGMAILIWIAMIIVSQAFTATPKEHAPAVVLGLLPGLAAWGWLLVEMTQLGMKLSGQVGWGTGLPAIVDALGATSIPYVRGLLSLKSGFMFSAMFIAAIAVFLTERKFVQAALWSLGAAVFSIAGLMHAYTLTPTAVREEILPGFAWQAALGYLGMAGVFAVMARARRNHKATS